MNEPLFIIGCPRSGTTLLADLLKFSSYATIEETHFITKYYKKLHKYGELTKKKNFTHLVKDILSEKAIMALKIAIDINKAFDEVPRKTYLDIVDYICMSRSKIMNKPKWGDKTPNYLRDLDIIYSIFPKAKFIYIVRDGRDVALSLLNRKWGPNNVYRCSKLWKHYNTAHMDVIDKLRKTKQLYELKYEDLSQSPRIILEEIYSFLQEEYSNENITELIKSIKTDNYFKWKTRMNQKQIRIFECVAGDCLKYFGYETTYGVKSINPILRMLFYLQDKAKWLIWFIHINTVIQFKIRKLGHKPFGYQ